MDISTAVEKFMDQEGMHSLEGERGVKHLAKLVNALGYQDFSRYGQQPGGYCLGDIFAFLEDNSGAVEAVVEWVKNRRHAPEWVQSLQERLPEANPVKDAYEDGVCPDCGEEIPDDVAEGQACENCGHAFYSQPVEP